jgi:hypothetical protein
MFLFVLFASTINVQNVSNALLIQIPGNSNPLHNGKPGPALKVKTYKVSLANLIYF